MFKKLVECIAVLHSYGIYHSDLKPLTLVFARLPDSGAAGKTQEDG
jgi:hypothetical protein